MNTLCFGPDQMESVKVDGAFREINFEGRKGLQSKSAHSTLTLPVGINERKKGSLTIWILPMEELSHRYPCADSNKVHPGTDSANHIIIGDNPNLENVKESVFALIWDSGWYPQYWYKHFEGYLYHQGFKPERKLLALSGHCAFQRLKWYQLGLSWDVEKGLARIYINGVKAGASATDTFLKADQCGSDLYTGSTAYAVGEVNISDEVLSDEQFESDYLQSATTIDEQLMQQLRSVYLGHAVSTHDFILSDEWVKKLDLSLTEEEHLDQFYVQGRKEAPAITAEGLRITTGTDYPPMDRSKDDLEQVYLWTEDRFEGDLYVTYEFMPLKKGGLSLLLTQASGLKGEDFMNDYPRRTTGSMRMVCWENVRNYHWEYYREVFDIPGNTASSGFTKNPWCTPKAYRCQWQQLEQNQWHRLEFIQTGNRLRGAIDGKVQFDVQDDGFSGNGPVYRHGNIAIRCMLRTDMLLRDLKVFNRKVEYTTRDLC